jgi:hypothetical protein
MEILHLTALKKNPGLIFARVGYRFGNFDFSSCGIFGFFIYVLATFIL